MDELWGLSAHPSQNQFVTTGYDKNLYLWDSLTHTAVWQKDLPVSKATHVIYCGTANMIKQIEIALI